MKEYMKYLILLALLLPYTIFAQIDMNIIKKEGGRDIYQVFNSNKITFSSATDQDVMFIKKTDGTTDVYKLSDVNLIIFDGIKNGVQNSTVNLFQTKNYPNPFEQNTKISFSLEKGGKVELKIFDAIGNLIKILINDFYEVGDYKIDWDGTNTAGNKVSSGNYHYQLIVNNEFLTKQMIIIK
jgi:hypothetical protein